MIKQKKYLDTRTNAVVAQFNIIDVQYMQELTENEVKILEACEDIEALKNKLNK